MTKPHLGTQSSPYTRMIEGDIAADGDVVAIYCPAASSVVIEVNGTFDGRITCTGAINIGGSEGGRLLFQAGVGSIGQNFVDGKGLVRSTEYRSVAGGEFFFVRGSNWVSGSVHIHLHTQETANITFINGPVHTTFEEVQRAGRAYSVGTGVQSVQAGNFLQYRFENPADSGKRYFIDKRLFTNNRGTGATNLEVGFFPVDGTPIVGGIAVPPNNLKPGGGASTAIFEYGVNSVSLGTPALGQILPLEGAPFELDIARIVEPGQSFAYEIGGAGGSLNNAVRVAATVIWFEELLQ